MQGLKLRHQDSVSLCQLCLLFGAPLRQTPLWVSDGSTVAYLTLIEHVISEKKRVASPAFSAKLSLDAFGSDQSTRSNGQGNAMY